MLRWQSTSIFKCFDDHMPTCLYAFELICLDTLMITYSYFEMLRWSHVHMHWYSNVWYPHTCAHTWMMKCLLARRLKLSCSRTFLCLNALTIAFECWDDWEIWGMLRWLRDFRHAEMIERFEVCVLGCLNTHMHVCFHDHVLACSHALLITYNRLTFL